jgi:pimeloyl-ACP methyl ester carboxylesterase
MTNPPATGYAPVSGVQVYWESRGQGGTPLVVVHGGFGLASMFGDLLDQLAEHRQVVAIELQGHGHTRDIDRRFSYERFGDDIAGVIDHLGLAQADLLGYSLGGGASLRAAVQHPQRVRRLALVSVPCRRDGWFPEVRAGMDQVGRAGFDQMRQSPMYQAWSEVEEVRRLRMPTLLVYADADSIPPAHAAEFFALLGGGLQDAGWDGSLAPRMHLAILPGLTHYNIFSAPQLGAVVTDFLS